MARKRMRKNGNGMEASLESLQQDLSALKTNMRRTIAGLGDAASHGATNVAKTASTTAEDVVEQVETLSQEGVDTVRASIRSQPLIACAISAGAGALIGALLARQ